MSDPSMLILYILLCICVLAHIALHWIRRARCLQNICRNLIAADMRQHGRNPNPSEIEEVLGELEEKEAKS